MAVTKTHTRSFAGGEITPEMFGRIDLAKLQTAVAEALNCWTLPHGPIQNRSGFKYINEVKDSSKTVRLIPFSFNTTQTYILEFGDLYVRFHTNGATLLDTAQNISAITRASPGVLTYVGADPANGTWMYLTGIGGMTQLNGRYVKVANVNAGANTFELTDLGGNNIDTSGYSAYTAGGTMAPVYEIVSPFAAADLFDLHFTQSADVLTIVHPSYAPRELRRSGATSWAFSSITFAPTLSAPSQPTGATGGPGGGTPINHYYKTTALASGTLEESLGSTASAAVSHDLTVAGNYIDVDPTPGGATVSGAVRYNVYKLFNGLYGYIGQTDGSTFRDDNVDPDVSKTPPEANTPFGSADNYPGAVGYYGGRRGFAGTNNYPQKYWLTRSGTESNLSYSIPTRDDDTIQGNILSSQVNRIRHIVGGNALVMLTSGGEWKIAPANSDILTPSSADPKEETAEGASNVTPVKIGKAILYEQESGGRLREMKFQVSSDGLTSGFASNDISLMAPHLVDAYSMVDMAYVKKPHKMIFITRSDGALLGLTYLPEHEVIAWHKHTTDGLFKSVAAVKEGSEYPLYAVIQRTINGRTVKYIERLQSRLFTDDEDAFFLDAALTYDSTAATTITGLWHLEGETVSILADGAVCPDTTVTNGSITLDSAASVVHIGLPYTQRIKTLPLVVEAAAAFGEGAVKNVNGVWFRVKETMLLKAGPDYDHLREYASRTNEAYGSPPALETGVLHLNITPQWGQGGEVCIENVKPTPMTILAMTTEVAIGG